MWSYCQWDVDWCFQVSSRGNQSLQTYQSGHPSSWMKPLTWMFHFLPGFLLQKLTCNLATGYQRRERRQFQFSRFPCTHPIQTWPGTFPERWFRFPRHQWCFSTVPESVATADQLVLEFRWVLWKIYGFWWWKYRFSHQKYTGHTWLDSFPGKTWKYADSIRNDPLLSIKCNFCSNRHKELQNQWKIHEKNIGYIIISLHWQCFPVHPTPQKHSSLVEQVPPFSQGHSPKMPATTMLNSKHKSNCKLVIILIQLIFWRLMKSEIKSTKILRSSEMENSQNLDSNVFYRFID